LISFSGWRSGGTIAAGNAGGTVEKAIFSITCTTCQARLAVRSEAAIGAILECPKCASMVHVVPPLGLSGITLRNGESLYSTPAGPPPLDRVCESSLTLELDPTDASLLDALFRHLWLVWAVALVIVMVIVYGLWWALNPRPAPASAAIEVERSATTSERPATESEHRAVEEKRPAMEAEHQAAKEQRPAVAVAGGGSPDPSSVPPGSQSAGAAKSKDVAPPPSLSAVPPRASGKNASGKKIPAEPDLFPMVAEEAINGAAKNARPVEIKKAPPAQVNIDARMADQLPEIELTDVPLAKALDIMAAVSTMPITLDVDAMRQLGVRPRDPISLRLSATTVGDALQAIVGQRGLAAVVENRQVIVTTPAEYRETLRKVPYTVADLTGDDKAAVAELAAMVRNLVAPESWQAVGGRGTIEPDQSAMVVVQTGEVHQHVLVFCEQLRNARQKPLRSRENPERFTLATRLDQARKLLNDPVTANFHEPTPLAKILAFLAEAAGGDIVIDRAALAAAETSDGVEATLTVEKQSLATALTDLLRPLGLTYRAIDANTIQVTSKEVADERLELAFYPIGPWLAKGIAGEKVVQRLKARVAASTWSDAGGPAEACFDPPSQCLIVLQSQPIQVIIERLLAAGPK
jgi:hypothetical protein